MTTITRTKKDQLIAYIQEALSALDDANDLIAPAHIMRHDVRQILRSIERLKDNVQRSEDIYKFPIV